MSRVLVVANETVGAEELLAEIRRIEDRRTSKFHVLAPAVADDHGLGTWNQEGAIQHAQRASRQARSRCCARRASTRPARSATWCPSQRSRTRSCTFPADMIVISTHPVARSRWLKKDLVESTRKKFARPVVHVVSHVSENATA